MGAMAVCAGCLPLDSVGLLVRLCPFPLHSPTDLSELLKEGTKESHERAENTQFVKDFLKGRIKRELFKVRLCLRVALGLMPSRF